ncbi:MAG: FecR family protein [Balneolales bacterium]|nr:FecR family protein [Balneolales bacterium]
MNPFFRNIIVFAFLICVHPLHAAVASGSGEESGFVKAELVVSVNNDVRQPLAIVRRFRPTVNVSDSDQPVWVEARVAHELYDRDTLRTESDGYAVVQLVDNSLVRVRPNSMLIIRGDVNDRGGLNSRIDVENGSINLNVSGRQSEYEVGTQTAVAAVKGTQFSTTINPDGTSTFICFSGEVEVTAMESGQTVSLNQRRRAVVEADGQRIRTQRVSRREIRRLEREEVRLEEASTPSILRIRLMNSEGEIREIDIPYFEN